MAPVAAQPLPSDSVEVVEDPNGNQPFTDEQQAEVSAMAAEAVPAGCPTWVPSDSYTSDIPDLNRLCNEALRLAPTYEAERVLRYGFSKLGTPYSQNPTLRATSHFDCSSFLGRAMNAAGANIRLPSGALTNFYPYFGYTGNYVPSRYGGTNLVRISAAQLQPGDFIIMFNGPDPSQSAGNDGHVQIWLGNNYILHAGSSPYGSSRVNVRPRYNSSLKSEWYFRYQPLGAHKPEHAKLMPAESVMRIGVARAEETVIGNLTVTDAFAAGFATVYACDTPRPQTSNLNFERGQIAHNAAIVKVGTSGQLCIYISQAAQVIWDQSWNGSAMSTTSPKRAADTRVPSDVTKGARLKAGQSLAVKVGSPNTAMAVNITTVSPVGSGFTTVWPCAAQRPNTSVNNYVENEVVANTTVVKTDDNGRICVYSLVDAHVIVDVFGEMSKVDVQLPSRVYDSRINRAGLGMPPNFVLELDAEPNQTVMGNLTVAVAGTPGYTTVFPCAEGPSRTSTNNFAPGGKFSSNVFVVRADSQGKYCIANTGWADLVVDQVGTSAEISAYRAKRLFDTRLTTGFWKA